MNIFFQQVLNGLTLGSVYALVALGLTLVYGILHIPNFAHGALYMVGAYMAFYLVGSLGANYWVAMAGAALIVALLAVLSDRLIFHRLRNAPPLHDMIAAIGILFTSDSKTGRAKTGLLLNGIVIVVAIVRLGIGGGIV